MENKRNERKVREGIVVSNKMDKTVVVLEETMKLHKLYKKRVKLLKKYKAIMMKTMNVESEIECKSWKLDH